MGSPALLSASSCCTRHVLLFFLSTWAGNCECAARLNFLTPRPGGGDGDAQEPAADAAGRPGSPGAEPPLVSVRFLYTA